MLRIESVEEDVFSGVIRKFISTEFPAVTKKKSTLVDTLTDAFVMSNDIRFGPMPSPESLVRIRNIIRDAVDHDKPIPVLSPWGSKKPNNWYSVDLAELMALRALSCLYRRINEVYEPGIELRIRLEDTTGYWIFDVEGEESILASQNYVGQFALLHRILNIPGALLLESSTMNTSEFSNTVPAYTDMFERYLTDTADDPNTTRDGALGYLRELGFTGIINEEQRKFLYTRYADLPTRDKIHRTARYFGALFARRILHGYGTTGWKDYIQIYFGAPIPGTPASLSDRVISYRTVRMKFARTHIAPWRARGILEVGNTTAVPKLYNWKTLVDAEVHLLKFISRRPNGEEDMETLETTVPIEYIVTERR